MRLGARENTDQVFCSQRLLSIFYTILFYKFICFNQPFQWASPLPAAKSEILSFFNKFISAFWAGYFYFSLSFRDTKFLLTQRTFKKAE